MCRHAIPSDKSLGYRLSSCGLTESGRIFGSPTAVFQFSEKINFTKNALFYCELIKCPQTGLETAVKNFQLFWGLGHVLPYAPLYAVRREI